jgi:hypothetical protein
MVLFRVPIIVPCGRNNLVSRGYQRSMMVRLPVIVAGGADHPNPVPSIIVSQHSSQARGCMYGDRQTRLLCDLSLRLLSALQRIVFLDFSQTDINWVPPAPPPLQPFLPL